MQSAAFVNYFAAMLGLLASGVLRRTRARAYSVVMSTTMGVSVIGNDFMLEPYGRGFWWRVSSMAWASYNPGNGSVSNWPSGTARG